MYCMFSCVPAWTWLDILFLCFCPCMPQTTLYLKGVYTSFIFGVGFYSGWLSKHERSSSLIFCQPTHVVAPHHCLVLFTPRYCDSHWWRYYGFRFSVTMKMCVTLYLFCQNHLYWPSMWTQKELDSVFHIKWHNAIVPHKLTDAELKDSSQLLLIVVGPREQNKTPFY